MGRAYTYHVIGYVPTGEGTYVLYDAMSRAEMAQEAARAEKKGHIIESWRAQTGTGVRILKGSWTADHDDIPLPKMVSCPVCEGAGCFVCNRSGIVRPNHWKKWELWQLNNARERMDLEPLDDMP